MSTVLFFRKARNKSTSLFTSFHIIWASGQRGDCGLQAWTVIISSLQAHRRSRLAQDPVIPNQNFLLDFSIRTIKKNPPLCTLSFYVVNMSFAWRASYLTIWKDPVLKTHAIWWLCLSSCVQMCQIYPRLYWQMNKSSLYSFILLWLNVIWTGILSHALKTSEN